MYNGKINGEAFSELTRDSMFVLLNFKKFRPKNIELASTILKKIAKTDNGNLVFIEYNHIATLLNLMISKSVPLIIRTSSVLIFN